MSRYGKDVLIETAVGVCIVTFGEISCISCTSSFTYVPQIGGHIDLCITHIFHYEVCVCLIDGQNLIIFIP